MSYKLTAIKALGLKPEDGKYYLTNEIEDIVVLEDDANIVVSSKMPVKILDLTKNKTVNIEVKEGSYVDYLILDSVNTNKTFDVYGELIVNQVSLKESNEALTINLLRTNANANVKSLAIANNYTSKFVQLAHHKCANTNSNVTNIAIAMNGAYITFDTTGKIEKKMAKTICRQLSRGIVMDNDSRVTSKPILLIDEYDVVANHGSTIGKVSDEDLFYLMSRGLSKKDAFLLILKGIIAPFVDGIYAEEWKNKINEEIENLIVSD